jgi:hypothetical protein
MQNSTAPIMSHALLCHITTAPFCEPFHGGPTPSIAQSFLIGPSHGQAREALVAIVDTLVIIVSLTVIGVGIWIMY